MHAENNMLTRADHMLIISYIAAAIVFSNAQCPGVITIMMISEFQQRLNINGKILIQVLHHKTASSMGPANIVITPGQEKMIAAVNTAFMHAENNMLTRADHMLIISYIAAAIVFSNAQRPGVITIMTISEFQQRLNINGKILIQVLHHKTASSMGPANIVITPGQQN